MPSNYLQRNRIELLGIPPEILRHVFEFLEPKDRASIARTSRFAHYIVKDIMLETIRQSGASAIPLLLCKILDSQSLGKHTKHLYVHDPPFRDDQTTHSRQLDNLHLTKQHIKSIDLLLQRYFKFIEDKSEPGDFVHSNASVEQTPREVFRSWYRKIRGRFNFEPLLGILLLLLPRLQTIVIEDYCAIEWILPGIFATATKIQRRGHLDKSFALSHLREITLLCHTEVSIALYQQICVIMEIPSLRRFTCKGLSVLVSETEPVIVHRPSQVKSLSLLNLRLFHDELSLVPPYVENLVFLEIETLCVEGGSNFCYLPTLLDSLRATKNTLKDLRLNDVTENSQPIEVGHPELCSIPSFTEYLNLRTVEVQDILFSFYFRNLSPLPDDLDSNRIHDYIHPFCTSDLPPNLEALIVTDVTPNLQQWELRKVMEDPKALSESLPHLKRVHLRFGNSQHLSIPKISVISDDWYKLIPLLGGYGVDLSFDGKLLMNEN